MKSETHYKSLEQLKYVESICKRPLNFYHEVEESYPEIGIYIKREIKPSYVKNIIEPNLRTAGFTVDMIELEPYDNGERGYNELVLLLDLNLFSNQQIANFISIVQNNVMPFAHPEEVAF